MVTARTTTQVEEVYGIDDTGGRGLREPLYIWTEAAGTVIQVNEGCRKEDTGRRGLRKG